jgi:hypothetical protein
MAEGKNWVEIALMPLVVAAVGIIGTYLITQQQVDNARSEQHSDRQVKLVEIFAEKITSPDEQQRVLALNLLRALDPELTLNLSTAVAQTGSESQKVQEVANQVANEARATLALIPRVYIHVAGDDERDAAQKIVELLQDKELVVPGIQRVGQISPSTSQLRYFRNSEQTEAERIAGILTNAGYKVATAYISGYENSTDIRPMHFELWFATGEPKPVK